MQRISPNSDRTARHISQLACFGLAILFLMAAILKMDDAPFFRNTIGVILVSVWPTPNGLPEPVRYPGVNIITTAVITWEAMLGVLLIMPYFRRLSLLLSAATLFAFVGVLVMLLFIPNPPSCGCLGGAGTTSTDPKTDAMIGIVRNTALIILALWSCQHLSMHPYLNLSKK